LVFPYCLAGLLVDGEEEVAALAVVGPAPLDDKVAIEHGGGSVAEGVLPSAEVGALPQLLAVVVVTVEPGRTVTDDDPLALDCGRGVAVPVLVPVALLLVVGDVLLPEELAVGAGEAEGT